ncbi:hypothetical protein [Micromonospora sp. NPDC048887]|uniref:hypothetical protein n=1 Tax=Micromonospora sp. NPDC048887 TaxID=3155614 RepID=UPI0033D1EEEF
MTAAAYGRAPPPVVVPESSTGLPPREYALGPRTPGVVLTEADPEGWLCPRCLAATVGRRDREKGWVRTNPRP